MPRQVTPSRPKGVACQRRCPAYARRRLTDELTPPAASTLARMGTAAGSRSQRRSDGFERALALAPMGEGRLRVRSSTDRAVTITSIGSMSLDRARVSYVRGRSRKRLRPVYGRMRPAS
jgi:hypothetical protein